MGRTARQRRIPRHGRAGHDGARTTGARWRGSSVPGAGPGPRNQPRPDPSVATRQGRTRGTEVRAIRQEQVQHATVTPCRGTWTLPKRGNWRRSTGSATPPPGDDTWVITAVEERDWGRIISWLNKRAARGSTATRDAYAGGGPFLVDRKTGRVAMCGSAHPVERYAGCNGRVGGSRATIRLVTDGAESSGLPVARRPRRERGSGAGVLVQSGFVGAHGGDDRCPLGGVRAASASVQAAALPDSQESWLMSGPRR